MAGRTEEVVTRRLRNNMVAAKFMQRPKVAQVTKRPLSIHRREASRIDTYLNVGAWMRRKYVFFVKIEGWSTRFNDVHSRTGLATL